MENKFTIQEYADQCCDGDRFRAIYEMVRDSKDGEFSTHIDELTKDEARFVLNLTFSPISKMADEYGTDFVFTYLEMGKETLADAAKEEKDVFTKPLIISSLMLVVSIALLVISSVLDSRWGTIISSIFSGISSINMANFIMGYFKFRKAKKATDKLPVSVEEACEGRFPTFEEAMEKFNFIPTTSEEKAKRILHDSNKNTILSLLLLPLLLILDFGVSLFASNLICFVVIAIMIAAFINLLKTASADRKSVV